MFVRLRAELRARWITWLAIATLIGIGAGVVVGLVAGAKRTANAYPEFAQVMNGSDVLVAGKSNFGLVGAVDLDDVEQLPRIESTARATVSVLFSGQTGDGRRVAPVDLFPVMPEDDRIGRTIERWRVEEGRRANPNMVNEATASFVLAERLDLHVGSTVRLHFVKAESFARVSAILLSQFGPRLEDAPGASASSIDRLADGPNVTVKIVGIEASPAEFPPLGPTWRRRCTSRRHSRGRTPRAWLRAPSCTYGCSTDRICPGSHMMSSGSRPINRWRSSRAGRSRRPRFSDPSTSKPLRCGCWQR